MSADGPDRRLVGDLGRVAELLQRDPCMVRAVREIHAGGVRDRGARVDRTLDQRAAQAMLPRGTRTAPRGEMRPRGDLRYVEQLADLPLLQLFDQRAGQRQPFPLALLADDNQHRRCGGDA